MPYAVRDITQSNKKISGVFLFLVQTISFVTTPRKMVKVSPVREILWLVFYLESPVKKYAAEYILWQNFIVFYLDQTRYIKRV